MKTKLFFPLLIVVVFFAACNNSENKATTKTDSTTVATLPKTTLKVTKQYVTRADGTVQENAVNAIVAYNKEEVNVTFADSANKSFTVKVVSLEKKVEGTKMKLNDHKYVEVFVSSGAQPQVTFSSDKGYGNMTFM